VILEMIQALSSYDFFSPPRLALILSQCGANPEPVHVWLHFFQLHEPGAFLSGERLYLCSLKQVISILGAFGILEVSQKFKVDVRGFALKKKREPDWPSSLPFH